MGTSSENKKNMTHCENKAIFTHKQSDIDHVNEFLFRMNLKKKDIKTIIFVSNH
jgi:hypothetical protein